MVSPVMAAAPEKRERYINPKHPMPKGYDKADIYPSTILERGRLPGGLRRRPELPSDGGDAEGAAREE